MTFLLWLVLTPTMVVNVDFMVRETRTTAGECLSTN
jgi:hypothetical protein